MADGTTIHDRVQIIKNESTVETGGGPDYSVPKHGSTHNETGSDPIPGKLADPQNAGWLDGVEVGMDGITDGQIVKYNATQDKFVPGDTGGTPDPHAPTHQDGGVDEIDVTGLSGQLADPQIPDNHGNTHDMVNGTDPLVETEFGGCIIERQDTFVVEDGGVVYAETELIGGGDLPVLLDTTVETLDCTTGGGIGGRARVALTVGTDDAPQLNFVYVGMDGGVATLRSSTVRPTGACAYVSYVALWSVAKTITDGPALHQRSTDAVAHDGRGRIAYIDQKLRKMGVSWDSGVDPDVAITTNPAAPDNVIFSNLIGEVWQLHPQTFPALSIDTDGIYVANASGAGSLTPYQKITDLNQCLELADGTTIATNRRFNLLVFGAVNKTSGECKLFANLPTDTYGDDDSGYRDVEGTAVSSVDRPLTDVAFLIARIPLLYTTTSGGTWQFINPAGESRIVDLRGDPINVSTAGTGGGGVSTLGQLSDVTIITPTEGDVLRYGSGGTQWENTKNSLNQSYQDGADGVINLTTGKQFKLDNGADFFEVAYTGVGLAALTARLATAHWYTSNFKVFGDSPTFGNFFLEDGVFHMGAGPGKSATLTGNGAGDTIIGLSSNATQIIAVGTGGLTFKDGTTPLAIKLTNGDTEFTTVAKDIIGAVNEIDAKTLGEVNTGNNVGAGEDVFRDKTGTVLNFRRLYNESGQLDIDTISNGIRFEINNVGGVPGLLATPQTPATHATSHEDGGVDEINVAGLSGLLATPQTPDTHAASHATGGGDTITTDNIQGRDVSTTAPTDGQILVWNNTSSQWEPSTGGSGGEANTTSNAGSTGAGLALPKSGMDLPFKRLVGGTNVTLVENTNDVTVNAAGGGGSYQQWLQAGNLSSVSSNPALLYKTPYNNQNTAQGESAQCIDSPFDTYQNGNLDPFFIPVDGSLDEILISFTAAATGTGSVGSAPTVRIDFYKIASNHQGRTLLGSRDVTISPTGIGTWNNLGGISPQQVHLDMTDITVSQGDLVGWRFTNFSGDPDRINSIRNLLTQVLFVAD